MEAHRRIYNSLRRDFNKLIWLNDKERVIELIGRRKRLYNEKMALNCIKNKLIEQFDKSQLKAPRHSPPNTIIVVPPPRSKRPHHPDRFMTYKHCPTTTFTDI